MNRTLEQRLSRNGFGFWRRGFLSWAAGVSKQALYANSVYATAVDASKAYLDTLGSASYLKCIGPTHP